jgi:hypothetical protein
MLLEPGMQARRMRALKLLDQSTRAKWMFCSRKVVTLTFGSWNQIGKWLRRVDAIRQAA